MPLRSLLLLAAGMLGAVACTPPPSPGRADREVSAGKRARGADADDEDAADGGASRTSKPTAPVATGPTVFGTLVASNERAADEAKAGLEAAMIEVGWDDLEPEEGRYDTEARGAIAFAMGKQDDAGRKLTLGLALHYTPRWVLDLPDSRFVDDDGRVHDQVPNLVFNQRLRLRVEKLLAFLAEGIPFSQLAAVRISSGAMEALFGSEGSYLAFDRNAQNGPDLPPSMPKNPLPGWKPGTRGKTPAEVRAWADWYVGSLADVVTWQIGVYERLGFRGIYEVLSPGQGVRPRQYDEIVAQGLPHGLLGTGAAWHVLYGKLPKRKDIMTYVSSVADMSGRNDGCEEGDREVALASPAIERWSAARWQARIARDNGFALGGENPGFACGNCDQNSALDQHYVDLSSEGMMAGAFRQIETCGFQRFYWAHDENLWKGTVPFQAYADRVAKARK